MRKGLIILLILCASPVWAKHYYSEAEYQTKWCNAHGGVTEHVLKDKTRVDCLTPQYAIEFDFAKKWHECIGQAQYYGIQTHRQPACVLIMEHPERDVRYLYRLRKVAYKKGIKTFTLKPEYICNPAMRFDCPHMMK